MPVIRMVAMRVALVEAGRAVHGAVELGFAGDLFAAGAGLRLRRSGRR